LLVCGWQDGHAAESAVAGSVSGLVINRTTGNGLEGARVALPAFGRATLVDATGRYVLAGVPPGTHELLATYTGLEAGRAVVVVASGGRVVRDFELSGEVYRLDAFKVAGEREGNAAALTQQRNAENLKTVVAMESYGNLPALNPTELAVRLPGVTLGTMGDEVLEVVSVRGMGSGMTTITIDGGMMASFGAVTRNTRMTASSGAMFESLEVIKGHTPDKGADSLGGTINMKTRSPLSMREKRRATYSFSAVHAAAFTEQIPLRDLRRTHPLMNFSYIEKFRVFGGEDDNLGVAINAFYSENAFGFFRTQRDFQQTSNVPAFLWDYRTTDNYNNRTQRSLNTKWDYRVAPDSLLKLNLILNYNNDPWRRAYVTRAFAGSQLTVPGAATGIVPGAFTDRITVVRALAPAAAAAPSATPTAAIDVTSQLISRRYPLTHGDLAGEHKFGPLAVDWGAMYSLFRYRWTAGEAALVNRIGGVPFIGPNGRTGSGTNTLVGPNGERGVGWILDRTRSDLYPRFIQNGGLDFTNASNYRPPVNGLTSNAGELSLHRTRDVRLNAKYDLPTRAFNASIKSGAQLREQVVANQANRRRWSYLGRDALPHDPSLRFWDKVKTGRDIPAWDVAQYAFDGHPKEPSLWQEDRYFHHSIKYSGTYEVRESVYATYLMTQGKIGPNGFLAGVRREATTTSAWGWVRERTASTVAQQEADPVGAAQRDYAGNLRRIRGEYAQLFPSVHLSRNLTPDLKGRLSWSTSFGRPSMQNALPTETVSEAQQTLTVGNPALLPQRAGNWDVQLEYAIEPSGSLSVSWFHKDIRDYILTGQEVGVIAAGPDNGFDGEYAGFKKLSTVNAGRAIAQGWEFSYLQQFRFLPGLLRTLSLNANLTVISIHGDFGESGAYRGNNEVPGFIPKTANVDLSWQYRRFSARVLWSYMSGSIRAFNALQPSRNQYMFEREQVNLGLDYNVRPTLKLALDVANLTNAPQRYYRGIPDQLETFVIQGTKITATIQGRF
jgi:TonB-dependent receptor